MHLKLDDSGVIDDGDVARDLGQDTADIVVLSAADSDLAAFSAAHMTLPENFPSVRFTNLLALGHPASIDLFVERTLRDAKIVVLPRTGHVAQMERPGLVATEIGMLLAAAARGAGQRAEAGRAREFPLASAG